ncbi:hypothetical protein [Maribacter sp. ACAM166]|uniref:hypothetical protein n=1 Tax=Maribacter sp. ACAM166 TaxID=2508996 RepID=UPI0010FDC430|nr:hypothetical protein [Maribacter sp. ACAM166]TLP80927.1 hypothetical protein ES765_05630 [Maribacter sp. ACAM166]
MIDFLKYELINSNPKELEGNSLLYFVLRNVTENGELIPILNNGKKTFYKDGRTKYLTIHKSAFYRGLEFKIYETTEITNYRRVTVEGSLHKYWNKGAHNFNDFGINEIIIVLADLKKKFDILTFNCVLIQLEIGVNIVPPIKTKNLIKASIMHKTKPFKWVYTQDEGNYIQVKNQRHFIKLYDKKTHYTNKGFKIDNEIMRIEKKWCKMVELNDKGIYTLNDLIKHDLSTLKSDLLRLWQEVLYCDLEMIKATKNDNKYNNVNWWSELNYENFKYHRSQLNKLIDLNPNNPKKIVSNLIDLKVDFLNMQTTEINPLHILLKTVVSTSTETDKNRRICLVTGLNISMQKTDSILLSHTGLNYYYKTDKKKYKEIRARYLSRLWNNADHKTQIKEIAHNIRNAHSNGRIKQTALYSENQQRLFNW